MYRNRTDKERYFVIFFIDSNNDLIISGLIRSPELYAFLV